MKIDYIGLLQIWGSRSIHQNRKKFVFHQSRFFQNEILLSLLLLSMLSGNSVQHREEPYLYSPALVEEWWQNKNLCIYFFNQVLLFLVTTFNVALIYLLSKCFQSNNIREYADVLYSFPLLKCILKTALCIKLIFSLSQN